MVTSSLSCDFLIIHRYKFRRINEIYIQIHSFISRVEKKSPTGDGAVVVYFLVTISWLDLKSLMGKNWHKFSNNEAVMLLDFNFLLIPRGFFRSVFKQLEKNSDKWRICEACMKMRIQFFFQSRLLFPRRAFGGIWAEPSQQMAITVN